MRPSFLLIKKLAGDRHIDAVEVGVRYGHNALEMLRSHRFLFLSLVDDFQEPDCQDAKGKAIENLSGFKDRSFFLFEKSECASKRFLDNSLDYVYIDADHSLCSVKTDLESWWPKVKDNGILAGHDYWNNEVRDAVQNFIDDMKILFYINDVPDAEMTDWMIIKKE